MDSISAFLKAIPQAAASPLAMVMYLATVAAWVYVKIKVDRLRVLLEKLPSVPAPERARLVEITVGRQIPAGMTPEQFIELDRNKLFLIGAVALMVTVIIIFAMAVYDGSKAKDRADNLIQKIMSDASAQTDSSAATLQSGAVMVLEAAAQVQQGGPPEDIGEMQDRIDRARMGNPSLNNLDSAMKILKDKSPGAKLQNVNKVLQKAASNLDQSFSELADCYRRVECTRGKRFDEMCKAVKTYDSNITESNRSARVPGIQYNASGAPPLMGNGELDPYFEEITAPNIAYLARNVCD